MAGHLLLAGYLGCGNLGDDAIMLGFVQGLGDLGYDVSVLSGTPEDTFRLYGFRSIPRKNMKEVEEAIQRCDALIFPGGSIFQDVTSLKSTAYYSHLVKRAKSNGKRVALLGQGVGPLKSFFGKRMAATAFQSADVVSVRDPGSLQTLKELGIKRPVKVTADCAFLLPKPADSDAKGYNVGTMRSVGISVRPHGKGNDVVTLFGEFCRLLYQSGSIPTLIEMDRNDDGPLILEIAKQQGGKIPDIRKLQTPMQLQQRLARMDSIVAMRLHAGILASTVGIPPLMVSYDPKVTAFGKLLDLNATVSVDGLTPARLMEQFTSFQKDRERNVTILARKREEFEALARQNIELVIEMMGTPARA